MLTQAERDDLLNTMFTHGMPNAVTDSLERHFEATRKLLVACVMAISCPDSGPTQSVLTRLHEALLED